ncbi:hypothetical protein NIES39_H00880 [Arthrospira platensis NIES-39]|nr:hypothetical protein NIES39_H00880 [Arthrospira platensis NIES-39]
MLLITTTSSNITATTFTHLLRFKLPKNRHFNIHLPPFSLSSEPIFIHIYQCDRILFPI